MNHRGTELTLVKSPDLARIPSAETLLVSSTSSSSPLRFPFCCLVWWPRAPKAWHLPWYLSGRAGQAVASHGTPIRPSHWPRVTGTTRFEIEPCRTAKKRARWAFGVNHRIVPGPHFLFLMLHPVFVCYTVEAETRAALTHNDPGIWLLLRFQRSFH